MQKTDPYHPFESSSGYRDKLTSFPEDLQEKIATLAQLVISPQQRAQEQKPPLIILTSTPMELAQASLFGKLLHIPLIIQERSQELKEQTSPIEQDQPQKEPPLSPEIWQDFPDQKILLAFHNNRLQLLQRTSNLAPLELDFIGGPMGYRRTHTSKKKELLVRALGLNKEKAPMFILDGTAGLGRDALMLAFFGAHVHMLERNPALSLLLVDALFRALLHEGTRTFVEKNLRLEHGDAREALSRFSDQSKNASKLGKTPDAIYLDPMYPKRPKQAAVKKQMQNLQTLLGHGFDAGELLEQALASQVRRVVIKRPNYAAPLTERKPDQVFQSKKNRFDVYFS